jgi:hypothetical protein
LSVTPDFDRFRFQSGDTEMLTRTARSTCVWTGYALQEIWPDFYSRLEDCALARCDHSFCCLLHIAAVVNFFPQWGAAASLWLNCP